MSHASPAHLITMLNQIVANTVYKDNDEQAAQRVASHLKRFWAPAMQSQILHYAHSDGSALSAVAKLALQQLEQPPAA